MRAPIESQITGIVTSAIRNGNIIRRGIEKPRIIVSGYSNDIVNEYISGTQMKLTSMVFNYQINKWTTIC
jgi:hypothetical protein